MAADDAPHPRSLRGRAREALLEAAIRCIREKGYARTTQRDLVAASGANPRSITYHFGSKERLMAEALGEAFRRRSVPMMEASAARGDTAAASFAGTFAGLLAAVSADRELAFALTDAISQARADDVRAALAEHYELMRRQGTALVEATLGEAFAEAGGDARTLSSTLLALFDGLVLQGLVDPEGPPAADALLASLRAALRVG